EESIEIGRQAFDGNERASFRLRIAGRTTLMGNRDLHSVRASIRRHRDRLGPRGPHRGHLRDAGESQDARDRRSGGGRHGHDLEVVVVGGGDTAMEESLYLSKLCKTVTVVHRRNAFRASKIMQDRLFKTKNIQVVWDSEVIDVLGEQKVEGVRTKQVKTGKTS